MIDFLIMSIDNNAKITQNMHNIVDRNRIHIFLDFAWSYFGVSWIWVKNVTPDGRPYANPNINIDTIL